MTGPAATMKTAPPHVPPNMARRFAEIAIVFAAYFIAGKLGQATTNIRSGNLGPVWPGYFE